MRATVSASAATGRKENLQAEAKAQAEGDIPSTKDNLRTGGSAVQVALEVYLLQGRTMERSKNSRRHAASARTTRKECAGGCRALIGASERGSNPIRKDLWEGTKDNLSPGASVMEATWNHNMGQGRTLERAKDN